METLIEALGPESNIKRTLSNTASDTAAEWYASLLNKIVNTVLFSSTSMESAVMEKSRNSLFSIICFVMSPRIKKEIDQ